MTVATVIAKVLSLKSRTVLIIAAFGASVIDALPVIAGPERVSHVLAFEVTQPPLGWAQFCARQPDECASTTTMAPRHLALSREEWMTLIGINKWANEMIKPLTDLEHWGVVEHWSYPHDGYGDCEDYVLLKRRMLIESGWPPEALLVTVVRDKENKGHAVLTVTTDKGDYVLDNQNEDVLLWWATGYRFEKRQSQSNPNVWVLVGGPKPTTGTATTR